MLSHVAWQHMHEVPLPAQWIGAILKSTTGRGDMVRLKHGDILVFVDPHCARHVMISQHENNLVEVTPAELQSMYAAINEAYEMLEVNCNHA